jgi:cytochrome c oxidase subunit 2
MTRALLVGFVLTTIAVAAPAEERLIEVKARKFSYAPNIIRVAKGDEVTIRLISEDVTHGFFLDGYGKETHANPGQDGSVSFVAGKTGRFAFRCSVTCGEFHPFMVGYLIVSPNIRFYVFVGVISALGLASLAVALARREA